MPTKTTLTLSSDPSQLATADRVIAIGRKDALAPLAGTFGVPEASWAAMLDATSPGDGGASTTTWIEARRVTLGVLPEACSRHNSPSRSWAIPKLAACSTDAAIGVALSDDDHAFASALAASRGVRAYSRTSGEDKEASVQLVLLGSSGPIANPKIQRGMDGVRFAARLVDAPASELHTDAFTDEARAVAERVGARLTVIRGEELRDGGFGGLWGVGKAATHPPALVALHHEPAGATGHTAWVGKGIVYDTGGLSIKTKTGMPGMKGDMGGAAAVLAAFEAAAAGGCSTKLTAILCLAENSVGPDSTRPDDILDMYSGKTVEVNNTDAEGRLVLADGVAWAAEQGADTIVDLATLTGAALVAVGKQHGGVYCNDEELEAAAVAAGKAAGETCFPLVYAPELFRKEFDSPVADMKNSVKDRGNAQSSCAGQFIGNHLPEHAPRWLHIDIAGPSSDSSDRGTGYGVGLLLALGAC